MSLSISAISKSVDKYTLLTNKYRYLVSNNAFKVLPVINLLCANVTDTLQISSQTHSCRKIEGLTKKSLKRMLKMGKSKAEMAEYFGCAKTTINRYLRTFGLTPKPTIIEVPEEQLRAQVTAGMSIPQIAEANNCSQGIIRNRLQQLGLKTLEAERAAKIPKEKLVELVGLGWDCKNIGFKYGISELQVGRLLKELNLETETDKIRKMITKQDILDLYEAGVTSGLLPEIFGIPEVHVRELLHKFELTDSQSCLKRLVNDKVEITKEMLEKMLREGKSRTKIAEELGVTYGRIVKKMDDYGLDSPARVRKIKTVIPDKFSLSQMLKKGATIEEIAEDYEVSVSALKNYIKKEGIIGYRKETFNYDSQLYEYMCNLAEYGCSIKEIAKRLNLKPSYVKSELESLGVEIKSK